MPKPDTSRVAPEVTPSNNSKVPPKTASTEPVDPSLLETQVDTVQECNEWQARVQKPPESEDMSALAAPVACLHDDQLTSGLRRESCGPAFI